MRTPILTLLLAFFVLSALGTVAAEEPSGAGSSWSFKRSVDLDLLASYAYKDSFGFSSSEAKLSYSPMLTYNYLLNETNGLGIVLLKFNHFPLAAEQVYSFAYGFQFKHYWNRKWADLGAFVPWLSYAILLNQLSVAGTDGRVMGHNTRMGLGTDIAIASSHRLVVQAIWDSVDYPALGTTDSRKLGLLSLGLGYRFLF